MQCNTIQRTHTPHNLLYVDDSARTQEISFHHPQLFFFFWSFRIIFASFSDNWKISPHRQKCKKKKKKHFLRFFEKQFISGNHKCRPVCLLVFLLSLVKYIVRSAQYLLLLVLRMSVCVCAWALRKRVISTHIQTRMNNQSKSKYFWHIPFCGRGR